MELFFDTETSGFINKNLPADDPKQAWIMQLAFILSDENRIYTEFSSLIKADGRSCHPGAQKVHQISVEECDRGGLYEPSILDMLYRTSAPDTTLIAHNIFFDLGFIQQMMIRHNMQEFGNNFRALPLFCTMKSSTDLCRLPGKFGKYKWPKLTELYKFLFDEEFEGAHDALADVRATRRCYYRLKEVL